MDKFEKILSEKIQNFEVPVTDADWVKFQQNFNKVTVKPGGSWKNYFVGGVAAVTVGFGIWYFTGSDNALSVKPKEKEVAKIVNGNSSTVVVKNNLNNENVEVKAKNNITTATNDNLKSNNTDKNKVYSNLVDVKTTNNTKLNVVDNSNSNKASDNVVTSNVGNKNKDNVTNANTTNAVQKVTLEMPQMQIEAIQICQGTNVNCHAVNYNTGITAMWLVNGDVVANGANFIFITEKPGNFEISLRYVSDDKQEITGEPKTLHVLESPASSIAIIKTTDYAIPTYQFEAKGDVAKSLIWTFGDGHVSTEMNPVHTYKKKGAFKTQVTATGSNGCKSTAVETVNIDADYNLLAPNAFSPNGSGVNDVFIPEALKYMNDINFTMTISDRSGHTIYKTSRVDAPWDGVNSATGVKYTGEQVFVWRVEMINSKGQKDVYMGTVTLLN